MNVIKHGEKTPLELKTEEFKCEQCGCQFTTDYDEYYISKGSFITSLGSSSTYYTYMTLGIGINVTDTYICSCPECHKIVTKTKQRTVTNPDITLNSSVTDVPDPCKTCSNNPSNGGSGMCNCTLGGSKITCSTAKTED